RVKPLRFWKAALGVGRVRSVPPASEPTSPSLEALIDAACDAAGRCDWEEASRLWGSVRERSPITSRAMLSLGEALLELGRFDEADAVLAEGLHEAPDDIWMADY